MEQVGRYRLTRRLGQGGMAEVFEAVAEGENGFRRRVALKRVLPQLASDLSIARMFLDEARTTSHLHHGNIVAVLDYGTAEGAAFQVLEFVDGLDLDGLMRRADERKKPLPIGLALHIVLQVAHALHYAHNAKDELGCELGIVHRDVSPSNVLIAWDGHIRLSDFGIALAANRLERTEGAGIKGKLEYMSPEQAVRGPIDRRSDVFALGCMLHRLITGKSPLGELSALTRMACGEELRLDPQLEPAIAEVIARATRNAQTQRYASAADLARALSAWLPRYLQEEPTFALQRWLTSLRDAAAVEKKRGALDALLNVELVLSAADEATQERSFAIHTPLESAPPPAVAADSEKHASVAAEPPTANAWQAKPKSARLPWIVVTLLLIAAAGGVGLYAARGQGARKVAPAPLPIPTVAAPRLAPNTEAAVAKPVDAMREDSPPPPTITPASKRTRLRPAAKSMPKPAAAAPTTSPVPQGVGTLVIGGDGALRAEIRIDGRSLGFAPKRVELDTGDHEVTLVKPDGSRVGPRRVHIEPHHTQSAPAKWIVD